MFLRTSVRLAIASMVAGILAGVTALPSLAGGSGSQKSPLFTPPFSGNCSVGSGAGQDGFVVVVVDQAGSRVSAWSDARPPYMREVIFC